MSWWARVIVDGRQVACRIFPPGKKGGPEWRAAKEWEEAEQKKAMENAPPTPTGLERLVGWGEAYLAHVERTMTRQTLVEKKTVMKAFFEFCNEQRIESPESITRPLSYKFLSVVSDEKGPNRANVYRKNVLAGWNWGAAYVEDFPQGMSPFEQVTPFPCQKGERYVPPEEDVIKVLKVAKGQDLVFLLLIYYTGARRGEVFRLSWEHDIDLQTAKIRLTDHKAGGGKQRRRWLEMHPVLVKALAWWQEARPCKVDNVFMQTQNGGLGKPYRQRLHFMANICDKAKVKPFGFHALRHKSAAITFVSGGLNATQILMGHARATTTDGYVRSAGLYADQGVILHALGNSGIGQVVSGLVESEMPPVLAAPEAFCTQENVHSILQ